MSAAQWMGLGAGLAAVGMLAAFTTAWGATRGMRDGQDTERPQIDSAGSGVPTDKRDVTTRQRANEGR